MMDLPERRGAAGGAAGSAHWEALSTLLAAALECAPGERGRFVEGACTDPAERRELQLLIEAHERAGPLDRLTDTVVKPLLRTAARPARPVAAPTLQRYSQLERLGAGGMGVVYRARDQRLERDVALKFLPPHLSSDEAAKKRFLVEARAAASLEHPNICTVHEIGESADGQLYIVMACYEGETLDRTIRRGPLPVQEAVRITSDAARGLAKAHERGIVHRDVKPPNIMITSDGVVKILDFGIAKLSDLSFTRTGTIVGTAAYMSPEQAFGDGVDHRSDVWALGVVLFEMLTGERPFRGPGEQALLFSILTQEPPRVSELRSDVPDGVEAILSRMLAKRVDDRYASMQELAAALGAIALPSERATGQRVPSPVVEDVDATSSILTRAGERRQVAVVVTSIAGYADLIERLGPDEVDQIVTRIRDLAVECANRHGGIVNAFAGEHATLLFGAAVAHEDDFLRAVRAAVELHDRVRARFDDNSAAGIEIRLRSGIHAGAAVAQRQRSGGERFRVTGVPLEVATRLAALAEDDTLLISAECYRVVAPFIEAEQAAPVQLQPDSSPVTPFRVRGATDVHSAPSWNARELTPLAGRAPELAILVGQLERAIRGEGSVAVVIGEAGMGKSRLLHELRARLESAGAAFLLGRCDAYGGSTPYLPFIGALRDLLSMRDESPPAGRHDQVVERLRELLPALEEFIPLYLALLSIPSERFPLPRHLHGEHLQAAMLDAIAALFTVLSRRHPCVLLLEDWHWVDDASRAALDQLGDIVASCPLLIVVSARPEAMASWTPGEHRTLVHLGPLAQDASMAIIRAAFRAPASGVAGELAQQLHERTGGNPFFLEETCHALREEGAVQLRDGQLVADDHTGNVLLPETVQAVIRTRLDRLDPAARDALRVASVIGREFTRAVLAEVAEAPPDLARAMERLRSAGLVQQTSMVPEPTYRFKHVLTQEVAYDTLLEHQRRALHGAAGRAIERRYADRPDDHLERLAHHFSRAGEWETAIRYGIRAAERAKSLSQFGDALTALDQVQEWLDNVQDAADRGELLADVLLRQERLCETLGLRARQLRIVDELIALLAPQGASARLAEAYLRQGDVCTLLRRFDAADRALETSLRLARERGDRAGERNALRSMGLLRSHEGRHEDAVVTIRAALALDEELGEEAAAAGDVASMGNMLRNMGRHDEALVALERALDYLTAHDDPTKRCAVMTVIAAVYRDQGRVDLTRQYLEAARDEAINRRLPILTSFSLPALAHILLEEGRVEEAMTTYGEAVTLSRRARHADGLAQSLRAIGEVLVGLERFAEALPHLTEAVGLFEQLEDRQAQGLMWSRIATSHARLGDWASAADAWRAAATLARHVGDATAEVEALEGEARSVRELDGAEAALALYAAALQRAVNLGVIERELSLRNTLGILHWERGAYPDALRQYDAVLRICRERGDKRHEGLALNSLGATLWRLRRFEEARTALEEAIRHNAGLGQRQLEAHGLAVLGEVFLSIGRPSDARMQFEASLAIRRNLADFRGEAWMLEHLARAMRASGLTAEAAATIATARNVALGIGDHALTSAIEQFDPVAIVHPN